ncbi:hypothetical protein Bbelb_324280 [Branchiostoma belcheri]|nr:hypothetical protein Bbelb_324280 [Branchiostoma belcheri]
MNISGQMESEIGAVGRRVSGRDVCISRQYGDARPGAGAMHGWRREYVLTFLTPPGCQPPVIRMNQKMERTQECLSTPLSHAKADCSVPRHRESLSDTSKLTSAGDPI